MAGTIPAVLPSLISAGATAYAAKKSADLQEDQLKDQKRQADKMEIEAERDKKKQIKLAGQEVKRDQKRRRRVYSRGQQSLLAGSGASNYNQGLG